MGTGFLSTPFVLPVLTEAGEAETAYRMLENEDKPGWLYEVKHGATTVWETWEGCTSGENNSGSLNHYSPGAVCEWLFNTVGGIHVDGERHFVIAPVPGDMLRWAEASYLSPYGNISCRWERNDRGIRYRVSVPDNCSAELHIPGFDSKTLAAGSYEWEVTK